MPKPRPINADDVVKFLSDGGYCEGVFCSLPKEEDIFYGLIQMGLHVDRELLSETLDKNIQENKIVTTNQFGAYGKYLTYALRKGLTV